MTDIKPNPLSEDNSENNAPLSEDVSENYNPLSGDDSKDNEKCMPEAVDATEASLHEIAAGVRTAKDQMQSLLEQMQDLNGAATALRNENSRLRSEVAKFQKLALSNDAATEILEKVTGEPEANEFAQMLLAYNPDAMILAQIMHDASECTDEAWQQLQQRNLLSQLDSNNWTMVIDAIEKLSTANRNQLAEFLREQLAKGNKVPFADIGTIDEVLDSLLHIENKDDPDL